MYYSMSTKISISVTDNKYLSGSRSTGLLLLPPTYTTWMGV